VLGIASYAREEIILLIGQMEYGEFSFCKIFNPPTILNNTLLLTV
jgi:hypothetical protein